MKFLLVDDNAGARSLLKLILGTSNSFLECSDGKDALRFYEEFSPDFVTMDIKMKDINGFEAAEEILSKYPAAKIFIVSDYDQPEFIEEAKNVGAIKLVSKQNLTILPLLLEQYGNNKIEI